MAATKININIQNTAIPNRLVNYASLAYLATHCGVCHCRRPIETQNSRL